VKPLQQPVDAPQRADAPLRPNSLSSKEDRFRKLTEFHGETGFKKRSVRGLTASIAGEGIDFLLRIGSISILARLLMPEYFGLLTMVTVVTVVAERFKDLGLTAATIQRGTITHEEVSTLFWINAGGGLVTTLIVAACSYPLSVFYHDTRLIPITLAMATTFLWSSLVIQHQALLNRQMKFTHLAAVQISSNALSLAIAIVLALEGAGYWALVAREVLRNAFLAVGTWLCMPWIPSSPSRKAKIGSMLRFGGDLTAFNLVYFFSSGVDKILVGRLFGAAPLGVYRQGTQLALLPMTQLTYPVHNVAQAILSRLQGDPAKYRRSYAKLLTALSSATMPLMLFLAVFAKEIVLVVFGEKWLAATNIFWILAVASFVEPAASTAGFVMLTCGKSRRYLFVGVATSVALVAFFVAGIPWGAEGIAFGHLACSYLLLIPSLWWSFRDTPINLRVFTVAVARPLLSSLLMGGVLYALKVSVPFASAPTTLVLGAVLMLPLYFGFWLLLPGGRSAMSEVWVDLSSAFRQTKRLAAA
jgi:O-antigen/teichoic acid export membrane protein